MLRPIVLQGDLVGIIMNSEPFLRCFDLDQIHKGLHVKKLDSKCAMLQTINTTQSISKVWMEVIYGHEADSSLDFRKPPLPKKRGCIPSF